MLRLNVDTALRFEDLETERAACVKAWTFQVQLNF